MNLVELKKFSKKKKKKKAKLKDSKTRKLKGSRTWALKAKDISTVPHKTLQVFCFFRFLLVTKH
jgi:hypothetical protein